MNKCFEISELVNELNELKNKFSYYKGCQERLKNETYEWMPSQQSRIIWEMSKQEEIWKIRQKLKELEIKIKETRKKYKELNREQNKKFNKQYGRKTN